MSQREENLGEVQGTRKGIYLGTDSVVTAVERRAYLPQTTTDGFS